MPYLPIKEVQEGQYLGHTIYGGKGNILLRKGVQLHSSYIKKLEARGYQSLYVMENLEDEVEINDIISPRIRNNAVTLLRKTIRHVANDRAPRVWRDTTEQMDRLAHQILIDLEHNESLKADLLNLKCVSEYTVEHSVNVGILSGYIGMQRNLNMKQVRDLIKAGIYHDIGKTFVGKEILDKPAFLTDEEMGEVRKHPKKGFQLLMNQLNISPLISVGSHLHHERWDGTGYPNGMQGEQIHLYGRIISVIDVFDAMTSDRIYRKASSNRDVLTYINSQSGSHFDPEVVKILHETVYPYPTGSSVQIGNDTVAVVLTNSTEFPWKPLVRVTEPIAQKGEVYDLAKEPAELQIKGSVI